MDEITPHLHLNLIPIADGRLCAKTLFDRKELQSLQTNLYEAVGMKWNLERGKPGSQAKHLSTAEYKAKKIVEQARGEASGILAEADQKAERKVQIARLHADGIVSQAERTEIYLDYRCQSPADLRQLFYQLEARQKSQSPDPDPACRLSRCHRRPPGRKRSVKRLSVF